MPPPRILVIRRRYLGDIALLGPVFRNLRLHFPDARIAALVEAPYAGTVALHADVDETLALPRAGLWGFARRVRAAGFTHVLDFDNTEKTALLTRFSGAAVRATYLREFEPHRLGFLYTHRVPLATAQHDRQPIIDTYLMLPAVLGVPAADKEYRLTPPAEARAFADAHLAARHPGLLAARRRLLVHPGSRSSFRVWPAERFARVIDRVQAESGAGVALVAGPAERAVVAAIADSCAEPPAVIDAPFTIPQLAALMTRFDALLCHDSGPMHLAAGVGTRVVALYGSQNSTIWRPVGAGHQVLQTSLPCACIADAPQPCVKTDAYRSYCVRRITEDEVFAAVSRALA